MLQNSSAYGASLENNQSFMVVLGPVLSRWVSSEQRWQ